MLNPPPVPVSRGLVGVLSPHEPPVYVAGAVRTPIGRFMGALSAFNGVELGSLVAREALSRAGVPPEAVDEVIFGQARQANNGPNPGRQICRRAGVPDTATAFTVNRACGSSLQSLQEAARAIRLGEAEVILAGGTESMTNTPYMLPRARGGFRLGNAEVVDGMYRDGLLCPLTGLLTGQLIERLAQRFGIDREAQDRYAVETHRRNEVARGAGRLAAELLPVTLPEGGTLTQDQFARDGVTLEGLSRLRPVFEAGGTLTAGNATGISDGAAAMVLLSARAVERLGVAPMARVVGYSVVGLDALEMGLGPVTSTALLLEKAGVKQEEVSLIEFNEAFAAQVLACQQYMRLDLERVNVNGGSIAIGHPIGATGARIVTTLLHELGRRRERYGLATLGIAGGMGMAMLFERV